MDCLVIDLLGFFFDIEIFCGNKYVLVIIDYFIKWVEVIVVLD